jgi:hypothetical protein
VTSCLYTNGGDDVIVRLAYTKPGGQVAFDAIKNAAGVQPVTDVGTDAVFDPATMTLYVSKDDALVAIVAGTSSDTIDGRLLKAKQMGVLVVDRL